MKQARTIAGELEIRQGLKSKAAAETRSLGVMRAVSQGGFYSASLFS